MKENPELIKNVLALWRQGLVYREIARACNISKVWARNLAYRYCTEEDLLARTKVIRARYLNAKYAQKR